MGERPRCRSRSPCHTALVGEGQANNGCMQKQRFVNSEPQSTRPTRQEGQNPKEGEHFLQEWQAFVGKNLRFEAKSGGCLNIVADSERTGKKEPQGQKATHSEMPEEAPHPVDVRSSAQAPAGSGPRTQVDEGTTIEAKSDGLITTLEVVGDAAKAEDKNRDDKDGGEGGAVNVQQWTTAAESGTSPLQAPTAEGGQPKGLIKTLSAHGIQASASGGWTANTPHHGQNLTESLIDQLARLPQHLAKR